MVPFPLCDLLQCLIAHLFADCRVKQGNYGFPMQFNQAFINQAFNCARLTPQFKNL